MIANIQKIKKASYLHRTATTAYPCYLPVLGEFSRSWSYKTCHGKGTKEASKDIPQQQINPCRVVKGYKQVDRFFKPAAVNPLLTCIIPGILYALFFVLHISIFPYSLRYGVPGFLWAAFYVIAVMYMAMGLNRLNIRLQL